MRYELSKGGAKYTVLIDEALDELIVEVRSEASLPSGTRKQYVRATVTRGGLWKDFHADERIDIPGSREASSSSTVPEDDFIHQERYSPLRDEFYKAVARARMRIRGIDMEG